MIHQYKLGGYNIVLDVCSGAVHVVDEVAYDMIALFENTDHEEIIAQMLAKYGHMEDVNEQELRDCLGENYKPYEKITFSVMGCEDVKNAFAALGKKNIIVCGTEAHICVLQSVIDLLAEGYNVYLVEDCIASRKPSDKETGIRRAMGEGALMTSAEAILFELTVISGTPAFKQISKLVK